MISKIRMSKLPGGRSISTVSKTMTSRFREIMIRDLGRDRPRKISFKSMIRERPTRSRSRSSKSNSIEKTIGRIRIKMLKIIMA